ncbi:MAG: hypothetical protein M3R63_06105 [Actinomycetota bacterium]|nr:hypothetical protein [Actinomycetota bacterium]
MEHEANETGQDPSDIRPPSAQVRVRNTVEPAIMQRQNERSRIVVDGRRTDDGDRCTLVVVHEVGGTWGLYPYGWGKFGVRLSKAEAIKAAQAILEGVR